jgi:hypothetical protein
MTPPCARGGAAARVPTPPGRAHAAAGRPRHPSPWSGGLLRACRLVQLLHDVVSGAQPGLNESGPERFGRRGHGRHQLRGPFIFRGRPGRQLPVLPGGQSFDSPVGRAPAHPVRQRPPPAGRRLPSGAVPRRPMPDGIVSAAQRASRGSRCRPWRDATREVRHRPAPGGRRSPVPGGARVHETTSGTGSAEASTGCLRREAARAMAFTYAR